ncbi:hypothetical protein PoB_005421400 [Plakobranchus ocellatus]|uniref:Uncharacterized protein n=1 Tax=Plakobranchus ocellatus TaxID=259542 RepID=A0AAV4C577_9GAST|nr:hypothetical protein PoB_005421400 [Plakobranchus ocellatus]
MNPRRGCWLPMQDAVWLLVGITTISMVITLHLGDGLGWLRSGLQIKILSSDHPYDGEANQVVRLSSSSKKSTHFKGFNDSIATDNLNSIINGPLNSSLNGAVQLSRFPKPRGKDVKDKKTLEQMLNYSVGKSKGKLFHTHVLEKHRDNVEKLSHKYGRSKPEMTQLSGKVLIRDDHHLDQSTKLQESIGNIKLPVHGRENSGQPLDEDSDQYPPELVLKRKPAGSLFAPGQGSDGQIVASDDYKESTALGKIPERVEEVGLESNEKKKERPEANSGPRPRGPTGQGVSPDLLNADLKDKGFSRGQAMPALVTYTRFPQAHPAQALNNGTLSAPSSTKSSSAGEEGEAEDLSGQDRITFAQALYDHISQVGNLIVSDGV